MRKLAIPVSLEADDQALLNQVVGYYHERLKQSPEALAYLAERGLVHGELIERFRLGYADRTLGLRLPEKTRKAGAEVRARLERIGLYRASGHEHFTGSLALRLGRWNVSGACVRRRDQSARFWFWTAANTGIAVLSLGGTLVVFWAATR